MQVQLAKGGTMGGIDMVRTGRNIQHYMQICHLSVSDIQRMCSCSHQAVYQWINGKVLPSVDNLRILASAFHVPMDDIVIDYM